MKRLVFLAITLGFVCLAANAFAASGPATVTYTEPSKNADGTTLTDLAKTTVYCQIPPAAAVVCATTPASKPSGGGAMSVSAPMTVPDNATTTVSYTVSATDLSGNESVKSAAVTKVFDSLPPAGVTGVNVQ